MNDSERSCSGPKADNLALDDSSSPYVLDLPVAPVWFSRPPKGTWEDGYRLSLAALEMVKNRPEVFEQRERCRCLVEFVM